MNTAMKPRDVYAQVEAIDWSAVSADLDAQGWAILPKLLFAKECDGAATAWGAARLDPNIALRSE